MKTKYILHGGFSAGVKQQNDLFFQEILRDLPTDAKVLLVYFAELDEKVQLRTIQDSEEFNANKGSKNLSFRVTTEETFKEDCAWADAIYLHGGKTVKIMQMLSKYQNLAEMFSDKTVAGDSAGANVLAKFFYSRNSKLIREGLGVLSLKIVAHYEAGTANPLAETEPGLPTVLLSEYEMKIITI